MRIFQAIRDRNSGRSEPATFPGGDLFVLFSRFEIECLLRPYNGDLGSYAEVDRVRVATDRGVQKLRAALTEGDGSR